MPSQEVQKPSTKTKMCPKFVFDVPPKAQERREQFITPQGADPEGDGPEIHSSLDPGAGPEADGTEVHDQTVQGASRADGSGGDGAGPGAAHNGHDAQPEAWKVVGDVEEMTVEKPAVLGVDEVVAWQ